MTLSPVVADSAAPFTVTEDWAICAYIGRHQDSPFSLSVFLREFGEFVQPFRFAASLSVRYAELSCAPADVRDRPLDEFAKLLCQEYFYDLSLSADPEVPATAALRPDHFASCRTDAIFGPPPPSPPEDDTFEEDLLLVSRLLFEANPGALAVLRGEDAMFTMRRSAIVIGYGPHVDINITGVVGERGRTTLNLVAAS
jgi:hypothetical protein